MRSIKPLAHYFFITFTMTAQTVLLGFAYRLDFLDQTFLWIDQVNSLL